MKLPAPQPQTRATPAVETEASGRPRFDPQAQRALAWFGLFLLFLCLGFLQPLWSMIRYASHSDLYSHVLLVPLISVYFAWQEREQLRKTLSAHEAIATRPTGKTGQAHLWPAGLCSALGGALLIGYWFTSRSGGQAAWTQEDRLAVLLLSFVSLVAAGGWLFLGRPAMRLLLFPFAFLLWIVPFPTAVLNGIETFLQYSSAEVASWIMAMIGLPVFRDGLFFKLPGITIRVAQECSGIRSTLVLLIISVVAGRMFLTGAAKRWGLTMAVFLLGIVRNGIRIVTIFWLCVYVSPSAIDSPIHHRGGPLFMALSLLPFCALLYLMRKAEAKRGTCPARTSTLDENF